MNGQYGLPNKTEYPYRHVTYGKEQAKFRLDITIKFGLIVTLQDIWSENPLYSNSNHKASDISMLFVREVVSVAVHINMM